MDRKVIEGSTVMKVILELVPDVNTIIATPSKHNFYLPHVYSSKLNVHIMLGKQHETFFYNRKMIKWQERIHNGNFMKTNHETKPRVRIRVKLKPVY